MTILELEKKYDLKLSQFDEHDHNYWAWKAEHRARPSKFWVKVSTDPELTMDFIEIYKYFLQWDVIDYSKWKDNLTFTRKFADVIDWWQYCDYFILWNDEETIREFINYIPFNRSFFAWNNPSLNFIREFNDKIKWFDTKSAHVNARNHCLKRTDVCDEYANEIFAIDSAESNYSNLFENVKFSKKMFNRFKRAFHLQSLIFYDCLDEEALSEVIEKHKDDDVLIGRIINKATMSEELLTKYEKLWDKKKQWNYISFFQILTENFMDKFKDKLNWKNLVQTQKMSEDFIEKHLSYIKRWNDDLVEKQNLSENFLNKHWDILNPIAVARFQLLSDDFIEQHFKDDDYLISLAMKRRIE